MLVSEIKSGLLNATDVEISSIFGKDAKEIMKYIMEILEMETSKKPVLASGQESRYMKQYHCPTCGSKLPVLLTTSCVYCGQILDIRDWYKEV